ncbi:hypothetical protein B0H67DRAFT_154486 [Lasiosphaeris hirsuta]|uniref:C2H2-type domain-containing protein n=1 Tax=Lasiosphaeris hirsuta TaxID=260670 RepID=A0AA40DXS3_9PEZI|nr:hypothetical protein B0H67DRAFT_154486 [Lasiosphaeris hirsuta]
MQSQGEPPGWNAKTTKSVSFLFFFFLEWHQTTKTPVYHCDPLFFCSLGHRHPILAPLSTSSHFPQSMVPCRPTHDGVVLPPLEAWSRPWPPTSLPPRRAGHGIWGTKSAVIKVPSLFGYTCCPVPFDFPQEVLWHSRTHSQPSTKPYIENNNKQNLPLAHRIRAARHATLKYGWPRTFLPVCLSTLARVQHLPHGHFPAASAVKP